LKKDIENLSLVKEKGKLYTADFLSDYCFIMRQHTGNHYELLPLPKACGYSRSTQMPIVYAEVTENKEGAGCEFKYVIKPESVFVISFIIAAVFLLCGAALLMMYLLGMSEGPIITVIFFILFTLFWLFYSFWGPCIKTLDTLERIVTHDLEQDQHEKEQLEARMREYEKAAGIDSDGFVN
jgi:hypothetical protein